MSSRRRAPTPGEQGDDQSTQESGTAAPTGEEAGPPDPAPAASTTWTVRRTELTWAQSMHKAVIDYQAQLNASSAAYYGALATVVNEAYERELAALADAAASEVPEAPDPQAATMAALRKWYATVEASRQEAYRAVAAARTRLAEDSNRAWLELLGKQQEANLQYRRAVEEAYATAPTEGAASTVIGDEGAAEGDATTAWAFNAMGDEGVRTAAAYGAAMPPVWAGWPAA